MISKKVSSLVNEPFCPNMGSPVLRWPYYQDIDRPGETLGHCPWCSKAFPVNQDVPLHMNASRE